ncbi:MAG: DUF2147 domain-containing protein [Elusimicrobia bacterium]|nr:DUF2147 domain-containing protein [Elusimicrobiota bacterium]
MKKILIFAFMLAAVCLKAQDVTGFWQTFYDSRHQDPKSVVAIYRYNGKIYGRAVLIYEEGSRGQKIIDTMFNPVFDAAPNIVRVVNGQDVRVKAAGLDVILDMTPNTGRGRWLYEDGYIINPQNGNKYRAQMRFDNNGNLVVRGHLRVSSLLGRSITAERFDTTQFPAGLDIPDYTSFVPDPPIVR